MLWISFTYKEGRARVALSTTVFEIHFLIKIFSYAKKKRLSSKRSRPAT